MEMKKIEEYVNCLLESWAVYNSGEEFVVWQTLHDLLMAVSRYELMSDMHKEMTTQLCKKLQHHFKTKFVLRERKETRKKKNFPPYPLLKEKIKKETEEKDIYIVCDADSGFDEDLLKRLKVFEVECGKYVGEYGQDMIDDFVRYWTLPNQTTGRMRFEEERYWQLSSKLKSWQKNSNTVNDKVAAMSLTKKQQKQQKASDRLWQQYADMKKGAVSHEEWLRMKEKETKT